MHCVHKVGPHACTHSNRILRTTMKYPEAHPQAMIENPAQVYLKKESDVKATLVAHTDMVRFQQVSRLTLQQFFSSKSLVNMTPTVDSSTGLQIQIEIMRESFQGPLSLLKTPNLCGLLRREAIKQNDLDKLKTHCPKNETIRADGSSCS